MPPDRPRSRQIEPTPKKGRRAASGTTAAAADALKQAGEGWPKPPVKLWSAELRFWDQVMVARLPQQWAQVDLVVAAELARAMAQIEAQRRKVKKEGELVDGRLNPRLALIEQLNRRMLAQMRLLQIHAVATVGPKRDQAGGKAEAQAAAAALNKSDPSEGDDDSDELLATPRRLQ